MQDVLIDSVVLVEIDAQGGETAYLTNAGYSLDYDGKTYVNSPAMQIKAAPVTGDMSVNDYKIQKMDSSIGVLSRLAVNVPYPKVTVAVKELFFDSDGLVEKLRWRHRGLVYQVQTAPAAGFIDIISRDYKYYLDRVASIPCTEECAVSTFGDIQCGATVQEENHVVDTVSGFNLTIVTDPILTTPFIFNSGIIKLDGCSIKIKYHESGKTFQMAKKPPVYWEGETVTIYTGCDRRLTTCRDIHNNEARFLGIGYSMIDYNPLYETP